jgi:hypothetical protein
MEKKDSQPALDFDAAKVEDSIRRVERNKQAAKNYRPHQGSDTCGHCGSPTREWRHTLSAQLGKILVRIYRHVQSHGNRPFMARDLALSYSAASNLQKIRYWGLIEHGSPEEERAGLWRLTATGEQFARATIRLRKKVWTYRTEVVEFEGDEVLISELLPDFSWRVTWAEENARAHAA